jgi:hypothetical protein
LEIAVWRGRIEGMSLFVAGQAEIRTRSVQPYVQSFGTPHGSFQIMFIPMDQQSELATIMNIQ